MIGISDCKMVSEIKKTVVALGMFDGVHIGHKKLIDTTVLIGKSRGITPSVYTFLNHPQELLGRSVARLCTNKERCDYMRNLGIERIEMVEFTSKIRESNPKSFFNELVEVMNPAVVVVGFNYTFGVNKSGNAEILQKLAIANGMDSAIVQPVLLGKQPVSSTRIRNLIEKGDVQQAQLLLGRTHNLIGRIVDGFQFYDSFINILEPNLEIILPAEGAYICFIETDNSLHPAMVYVSSNKKVQLAFTHSPESLIGKEIRVRLVRSIRLEDVTELSELQFLADRAKANNYFGNI